MSSCYFSRCSLGYGCMRLQILDSGRTMRATTKKTSQ
jgi:hypothetical protein